MIAHIKKKLSSWTLVLSGGIALYIVVSGIYLFLGQLNADEAWYLYAGQLIRSGAHPYVDFAYTQTPLLAYTYAFPQILFGSSIYVGRITSIVLTVANLAISMMVARKYAGTVAAVLVAVFFAAFTYGVYYNTIVKTYALTSLLFTLSLAALALDTKAYVRYGLAFSFAVAAAFTRLSALPFAVLIAVYAVIMQTDRRTKLAVSAVGGVSVIIAGIILLPDFDAAYWNLIGYHTSQWGNGTLYAKVVDEILTDRVRRLGEIYGIPLLLLIAGFLFASRNETARQRLQRTPCIFIFLVGAGLFIAPHFASGDWHTEYLVPAFTSLWTITAILLAWMYDELRAIDAGAMALSSVVVGALVILPFVDTTKRIDFSGGRLPMAEIHQAAEVVQQHTGSDEPVLALRALWVPLEAQRTVLSGLNMAQFSYQPQMNAAQAEQYHVVNFEMLLETVDEGIPGAVILTEEDIEELSQSGRMSAFNTALERRYTLVLEMDKFGQRSERMYVYVRNDA